MAVNPVHRVHDDMTARIRRGEYNEEENLPIWKIVVGELAIFGLLILMLYM